MIRISMKTDYGLIALKHIASLPDGDLANAKDCRAAGADTFVAGTSFFKAADLAAYARTIARLA